MTKQYRITRTYLVTTENDEDIQEKWRNIEEEWEYLEDEQIELIWETNE